MIKGHSFQSTALLSQAPWKKPRFRVFAVATAMKILIKFLAD